MTRLNLRPDKPQMRQWQRLEKPKMKLSHYTDTPLKKIRPINQADYVQAEGLPIVALGFKPVGLWVSVDGPDDWPSWCADSQRKPGKFRYRITLKKNNRILHIKTVAQLHNFTKKYAVEFDPFAGIRLGPRPQRPKTLFTAAVLTWIDWIAVAKKYSGIIIAPYRRTMYDLNLMWYYTWDCASGCIWDASVIARVRKLPEI